MRSKSASPRQLAALLILTCALASPVPAADWRMFRGPNGSGIGDGHPLPEVLDAKHTLWKATTPPGSSSPVIYGDLLFLTGLQGDDLVTLALDRETGRTVWQRAAPRTRREKLDPRNHPAASSPAVDGERVVVFFGEYGMLAYDHEGNELWRHPLGPFNNVYGTGASPVLAGETVLLAVDQQSNSYLLAVSATNGKEVWKTARPEAKSGHSTPILFRPTGGEMQALLPGSFYLTSYSVATGARLWWVEGLSFEMKSTPVVGDGVLYIHGYGSNLNEPGEVHERPDWADVVRDHDRNENGTLEQDESPDKLTRDWFGFVDLDSDARLDQGDWEYFRAALRSRNSMLAIRLPDAGAQGDLTRSHVAWQYFRNVPQLPSPLLYRNVLYMINDRGIVTKFTPAGEVLERGRIEGAVDSFYASPVAGDGKVYFASRSGTVAVLRAGEDLTPLSVTDLEGQIDATPAIADGTLYVRAGETTFAFRRPSAEPAEEKGR